VAAAIVSSGSYIALQGGQLRRGGRGQVWIGACAGLDEGLQRCGEPAGRALEAVGEDERQLPAGRPGGVIPPPGRRELLELPADAGQVAEQRIQVLPGSWQAAMTAGCRLLYRSRRLRRRASGPCRPICWPWPRDPLLLFT
jgi:hypothetical protein